MCALLFTRRKISVGLQKDVLEMLARMKRHKMMSHPFSKLDNV